MVLYSYIGDYMAKKFKAKKKIKLRLIIYLVISMLLIFLFKIYITKINIINSNEKFINNILSSMDNTYVNNIYNYINKNIFNTPVSILNSELKYENNKNKEEKNTSIFAYVEVNKPRVYIYNSHQGENYSNEYLEEHNIVPNVLTASLMLKEKLNNIGINTIVEENNILEYMDKNNLDHSGSYLASRHFLEQIIKKYNSIELYIDLHRDSIEHSSSYVKINDKDCAKILFVIGLENENYKYNLEITQKINNIINTKYPGLSRGIMKKQGYGVNGIYNQDLKSNIILIEIGGFENNIEEVNNTLEFVAIAIKEYLNE